MNKHLGLITLAALVVAALLVTTVAFAVDQTRDIVLVKTFGKITAVYNGNTAAGLHFKWPYPIQERVTYDAREQIFEDTGETIETKDKQNVVVTLYCVWRISDPAKFNRVLDTMANGQSKVRELLRSAKNNVIHQMDMADLVNTNPNKMLLADAEKKILKQVSEEASSPEPGKGYGIEVVAVGFKSLGLPENVTKVVINAMKQERQKFITDIETRGKADADAIRDKALAASREILAFAQTEAAKVRAQGELAAAEEYRKLSDNPGLAIYLRWLKSLESQLKDRSVIVLDPSVMPGLKFFMEGPSTQVNMPDGVPLPDKAAGNK